MLTGEWRFCRGFCKKWGARRGFLMVRLWWIGGETWWEDALILDAENLSVFSGLFFGRFQPKDKSRSPFGDDNRKGKAQSITFWEDNRKIQGKEQRQKTEIHLFAIAFRLFEFET
jgi:hypothetical protein